jgi:hypothetical protein
MSIFGARAYHFGSQSDVELKVSYLLRLDPETDSVEHFCHWHAAGRYFRFRVDDHRIVTWQGCKILRKSVASAMEESGAFRSCGAAMYHRDLAQLCIAETSVRSADESCTGSTRPHDRVP